MTEAKKPVAKKDKVAIKVGTVKHYEFIPLDNISTSEINEMAECVRIGVAADTYDKFSPNLRKHFKEIK